MMNELDRNHVNFILRCWREEGGELSGVLIEVLSRRSHTFRQWQELRATIEQSMLTIPADEPPGAGLSKDEPNLSTGEEK